MVSSLPDLVFVLRVGGAAASRPAHSSPEPVVIRVRASAPIGTMSSNPVKASLPGPTVVGATVSVSLSLGCTVVGPTVALVVVVKLGGVVVVPPPPPPPGIVVVELVVVAVVELVVVAVVELVVVAVVELVVVAVVVVTSLS